MFFRGDQRTFFCNYLCKSLANSGQNWTFCCTHAMQPGQVVVRQKAPPECEGDIDCVLAYFGRRARVVQLWRRHRTGRSRWIYAARLRVEEYYPDIGVVEVVQSRFGGGVYKAKVFGHWSREARREEFLQQTTFRVDGPLTQETLESIRRWQTRERRIRQRGIGRERHDTA